MSIPQDILDIAKPLVQRFEGCKLAAYQDSVGVWTIGWGHTPAIPGTTITQEQADQLLETDLAAHYDALLLVSPTLQSASSSRVSALLDFVYNLGIGAYRNSMLRSAVDCQAWQSAKAQLAKWVHAGGKVLPGLVARRQAEIDLLDA
jgi:lysozyme